MTLSIVRHRKIWYTFGGALVVASLISTIVFGLNFGIDFTGGSLLEVKFSKPPAVEDLRQRLVQIGYDHTTVQPSGDTEFLLRFRDLNETEHQQILQTLRDGYGDTQELRFDSIGPSVGKDLRQKTSLGVVITLVLIGVYVAIAFRKVSDPVPSWKYSFLTVLVAFHDVIVPIGVFACLGKFFGWQIDTSFVAAVLTILGYSINDTIVVFDRTRENLLRSEEKPFEQVVEESIHQTLTRSFNTGLASLLTLLAISIWGGDTTRPFAVALILGIVVGTYSSIFLASPLLVTWEKWGKRHS